MCIRDSVETDRRLETVTAAAAAVRDRFERARTLGRWPGPGHRWPRRPGAVQAPVDLLGKVILRASTPARRFGRVHDARGRNGCGSCQGAAATQRAWAHLRVRN